MSQNVSGASFGSVLEHSVCNARIPDGGVQKRVGNCTFPTLKHLNLLSSIP